MMSQSRELLSLSDNPELNALYNRYSKDPVFSSFNANFVPGIGPVPANILLVGEAPGAVEDAKRTPFVGRAGKNLNIILSKLRIPREDIFLTNILKFRPPGNRDPLEHEIISGVDYVEREIDIVQPKVVGLLGRHATRAMLGDYLYFKRRGEIIEGYVPLYHPMVVTYKPEKFDEILESYKVLLEYV